jgi:cysteinyl-tRNA synthetase
MLISGLERLHSAPRLGASVMLQLALAVAGGSAAAAPAGADLANMHSWGYQLQQVERDLIAATPYDLMVIDYSPDGSAERAFSRADVAVMQRKPGGGARVLLAYLSIGEAEDYRSYWQPGWRIAPPAWLREENPDWPGNYAVRYWDPQWQRLIMGSRDAYLDHIIAAGFDGVYLDRVDAFDAAEPGLTRARRMQLMTEFVIAIAAYARRQRPDFMIVVQNGEELLDTAPYAASIDAVGKEDLFFGLSGDGVPNSKSEIRASLGPLQRFQASGKPVFLVEYLESPEAKAFARKNAAAMGAALFIGSRELDDVWSR